MKQKTLLNLWLLLCLMLFGGGSSAWAVSAGDVFARISSLSELSDGDEIIFVNQAETYACGTTQNTNNRTPVSISISDHAYTYDSKDNVQVFVVKINASGKYGFHTGSGYIYSASAKKNYLNTNTTASSTAPSGTSAWTLSISNYVISATNVTNTSYYLAFNGTSYFSQYSSGQSKPYIYKKQPPTHTLTFSATNGTITAVDGGSNAVSSGSSIMEGATVTVTATPSSGYNFSSWSVSGTGSTLSSTSTNPTTFTMGTADATVTANFESASAVSTPTFSVTAGTYNEAKSVELSCGTDGATIYYTTNGDTPTSSSTEYTGAIAVNVTTTIKAIAIKDGLEDSGIASATYTLKCATPTITVPDGLFVSSKTVTITSSEGASIYYTTDGSTTPTNSSTAYDSSNKPSISATTTVKAIATKSGWSDSDVATETFTKETVLDGISALNTKTNTSAQSFYVNLTDAQITFVGTQSNKTIGYIEDATAGAYIYNLSITKNKVYNGVFQITYQKYSNMPEITGITAVEGEGAVTDGSDMDATMMTPSALDAAFTANLGRQIQINSYTVPVGKALTENIALYETAPYTSVTAGETYNLVGYPYIASTTKTFRITSATMKPAAPTFDNEEGEFSEDFTLHLSTETDGATIYYTTDGSTPTSSSSEYDDEDGISISGTSSVTVKAIAVKNDVSSDVSSATYTYTAVKTPAFGSTSGTSVYYGTKVTVSTATDGAALYYTKTTNGDTPADPTDASTEYPDGGISIDANTVKIKVIAKKGDDYSSVAEATYTLKTPDNPTFSLDEGLVSKGASLSLTTSTGATIRYTTDGTMPSASVGTVYTGAISLNVENVKAIAYDPAGNTSSVVSKSYTLFVGDIVTFDASSDTGTSLSKNGVSFSTSATADDVYKFYKSSSTTFSVTNGLIKQIEFTGVSGYAISNMTASAGSLATDGNNGVWTGSASSVTFTASKAQTRATKIKVYVARTAAPTFSVDAGEYSEAKSITISCATDDADIYYTTDGSTPTSSSTEYTGSISITETTTLKAIAIYDDVESPVASATYTMNRPAAPEFDVEEGYFDAAFDLHLSTETDGATIYYTTDGSTPTNESSEYSTKVAISAATTTVKAIAVKNGLTSDVSSVTYTYDTRPAPTFTLSDTEMTILVLSDDETITLTTNSDGAVTFTSSDDEKLDVDNSDDSKIGVLTAYKAGDYTITVQTAATSNYLAGEGTVIVHVVKKTTTMSIGTTFKDGKDLKTASEGLIEGIVKYNDVALSPQPTITYSSSDETVATVDEDGIITFLKAGTTTLTASFEGTDEYAECEGTYVLALYDSTPQEVEVTIALNNSKTSLNTATPNGKTLTVKNVSVTPNNGGASTDLVAESDHVRMYKNSNMVVTAPTGYVLTGISFTEPSSGNKWDGDPTPSVGTYSSKSWTGKANTVTFTFSAGQCRIASITVTLAPSVTLNKYGYATYCSAHPIDFSETEGFTAWRVSEASSDGTISFVKITDTIKEGQGVLLYNKNADGENKTTVTLTVGESDGSTEFTTSQNKLVGTLIPTVVENDEYFGLSGNKFLRVNAGTVPAGKALLPASVIPAEARELTFVFLDDEVTGIRTIDNGKMAMDKNAVYDLSGRRVQNPKHGLYIVNGKKVIIK